MWPAALEQPDDFASRVRDSALRWPVDDPLPGLKTVFANLPSGAYRLAQMRRRTLDEVNLACAFDDYNARRVADGRAARLERSVAPSHLAMQSRRALDPGSGATAYGVARAGDDPNRLAQDSQPACTVVL